jgi:hypothetical protein
MASAAKQAELTPEQQLIRQLDTLNDLAASARDDYLGANFFEEVRRLYNLQPTTEPAPSFRPVLNIPQLQFLALMEASDLADNTPRLYLTGPDGKLDEQRQSSLMSLWRHRFFDLHTLYASIWSLLGGTGFLQGGFDPYARTGEGLGEAFLRWRDPSTVFADPAASSEDDWNFVIIKERLWPEEVYRRFPSARAKGIAAPPAGKVYPSSWQNFGTRLTMPPGPMSASSGYGPQLGPSDGRLEVRYTYIYDSNVREIVRDKAGTSVPADEIVPAKWELMYPNGRYIVDIEGHTVYDDNSPHPTGFPLVRVLGLPAITSFWAPPPTRFTKDLQELAIRMLRQVFENAVRVNNVVWFIDSACGISPEDFGGLPGEVRVYNTQGKMPEMKAPVPFPQHFLTYPQTLLNMQKELWGFSQPRQGNPGAGNVGNELFESAVLQSQSITRLRGKLLATSIERAANMLFQHMARYQTGGHYPDFEGGFKLNQWKQVPERELHDYSLWLDPASINPISSQALRRMLLELRKLQAIDTRTLLQELEVPGASQIADRADIEHAMEALSKLKRR